MSDFYRATLAEENDGVYRVVIGMGAEAATNAVLVPEAVAALKRLGLAGGRGIHFDGPATLPVAMALAHAVGHLFGYVACSDPKLKSYVVVISHDPGYRLGQLIPWAGQVGR